MSIRVNWPLMAAPDKMREDIRKFEEIGTHPAANHNAISEALTFHEAIGPERKAARLRYLRTAWEERLGRVARVKLLTSRDPRQSGGLAMLSVEGKPARLLADQLWEKHRIMTTPIEHKDFQGLRITPNIYTTLDEIDTFCSVMEKIAG